MRFMRRSLVGLWLFGLTVGMVAMAGGLILSAVDERAANERRPPPARERVYSVKVVSGEQVNFSPVISTFGEVLSVRTLELRAPEGGSVVNLSENFVEGGIIRAGETILRIDPADAQSEVDFAVADLNDAKVELLDAERALALARDEQAAAEEQADLRLQSFGRQKELKGRGVVTDAAVENAALAHSSAQQAVLTRRRAVSQAETRLGQAQSLVSRREIGLAESRRRLEDTSIVAEFSGILSDVSAVKGGLVNAGERVARLIDPYALEIAFKLSNSQYARLIDRAGRLPEARVEARLDLGNAALVAEARLVRESGAVGEGEAGRQLFARIEEGQTSALRPGDFVSVGISERELRRVIVLPSTAIDADGDVLVVGEGGRLEELGTELLRRQGNEVVVRAPLAGRQVVAERSPLLGPGIRIRAIREDVGGVEQSEVPQTVELSDEERQSLIKLVESNSFMPDQAKQRVIRRLNEGSVPQALVDRITARAGG